MPLRNFHMRTSYRRLASGGTDGMLRNVSLLKRGNDQQEGTVTAYTLYSVYRTRIAHTGEPLRASLASGDRTVWMLPKWELQRVGVNYINALDRIVELSGPTQGATWMPESTENIDIADLGEFVNVACRRCSDSNGGGS